jgi:vancomycin resistance protein YoaR
LACVLALGSLSVAAAHWWPGAASTAGPAPTPVAAALLASDAAAPTESSTPVAPAAAPTADTVNRRLADLADPAAHDDVTLDLSLGESQQTLHRSDLAALLTSSDGQYQVDVSAVRSLVGKLADDWDQPMLNARFNFSAGHLVPIRESQEGRVLDEEAAATAIVQAISSGVPTLSLPGRVVPPQVASSDADALGITTNLDRGGTSFAGSIPEKAHNIRLAAQRLNGVVIPPGGVFSFNQEVGPTTLNAGFEWGFGIEASDSGARTVPSVAGGICQVATTLFQRAFWAGFPLVERHWHLYWIPAYTSHGMVGLDSTVDADSGLDLRFSNPTDGYILIQSATDDSNVYFGLYGSQRNWKVTVDAPRISNTVAADPAPLAQAEPSLAWGRILPVEAARDGFDVSIQRTVTRDDGQPHTLSVESKYEPSRSMTLVGTRDKPAGADVDAVLARLTAPARAAAAAQASPSPAQSSTAVPVSTNAPAPGAGRTAESPPPSTPTPPPRVANVAAATSTPKLPAAATPTPVPPPAATATATRPVATAAPPTAVPKPPTAAPPTSTPTRH